MVNYRRVKIPGGTYFLTLVTKNRKPIFQNQNNASNLIAVINKIKKRHPFKPIAGVLLHDHLHLIWELPSNDSNYSLRVQLIKQEFNRMHFNSINAWQNRFWEHTIRDENDLHQHLDYIHYNPVKHRLTHSAKQWRFTSLHRYIKDGLYPANWCDFSHDIKLPSGGPD